MNALTCAVCEAPSRRELCDSCASDPANVDWIERKEVIDSMPDDDKQRVSMQELFGRAPRGPTAKQKKILELFTKGQKLYRYRYIDRRGVSRGYRIEKRPLTHREVAERTGCTERYVRLVLRTIKFARSVSPHRRRS